MNNNNNKQTTRTGISFTGALTLIFITLKLTHVIDWSWMWVLAPMWMPITLILALLIIAFVIGFIVGGQDDREDKHNNE